MFICENILFIIYFNNKFEFIFDCVRIFYLEIGIYVECFLLCLWVVIYGSVMLIYNMCIYRLLCRYSRWCVCMCVWCVGVFVL